MAKCRFLYDNIWKSATLTASTSATNFPATHTQKRAPGRRWRSTTIVTDQSIVANLGAGFASLPVKAFFIRGNNFSAAAVVTIQATHTNDAGHWAAPDFEAILSPVDNVMMGVFFAEQIKQYWRLLISDAANTDFYVEVGPCFLGTYFQPVYNYAPGRPTNSEDLSVITKSAGGQRTVVIQDQPGIWQYDFTVSEKSSFETIRQLVGCSVPFFFCEDSDIPNTRTRYSVATSWRWRQVSQATWWTLDLGLAEEI